MYIRFNIKKITGIAGLMFSSGYDILCEIPRYYQNRGSDMKERIMYHSSKQLQ